MRPDITIGGRYLLKERVGQGGMGEVWRASHVMVDRPVAVKIVLPGWSSDVTFARRFRREAQIAASLDHPGITTVYDVGEEDGRLFVVMEWLDGRNLDEVIQRNPGGLPVGRALDWGRQIAEALAYAHAEGVVHRDIKPANLMLKSKDTTVVKVCDFGIARSTESTTITLTGHPLGTAAYMAPEQCRGARVDGRADLYSLGCVVYELLAGRTPFPRDQRPEALMYQHVNEPPPPLRSIRPDISAYLEVLLLRLLAKDPGDRFGDAAAVAREFGALLAPPRRAPASGPASPMDIVPPIGDEAVAAALVPAPEPPADARVLAPVAPHPRTEEGRPGDPRPTGEAVRPASLEAPDTPADASPAPAPRARSVAVADAEANGAGEAAGCLAVLVVVGALIAAAIAGIGYSTPDLLLTYASGTRPAPYFNDISWSVPGQGQVTTTWHVAPGKNVTGLTGSLTLSVPDHSSRPCTERIERVGNTVQWYIYFDGTQVTAGTFRYRHVSDGEYFEGAGWDNQRVRGRRPHTVRLTVYGLPTIPCPVRLTWIQPGLDLPGRGPWRVPWRV